MDSKTKDAHQPEKTKTMIFNFTDNYQFTKKLNLNNFIFEVVTEAARYNNSE